MFTYNSEITGTNDQLRLLVQDTTETGHFLEDEEIAVISAGEANLYRAAAVLCRIIAARINKLPGFRDKHVFDPEQKAAEYRKLAADYDLKADSSASLNLDGAALAGFLSGADDAPAFTRRLHRSPGSF